jgi:hypothetical protein
MKWLKRLLLFLLVLLVVIQFVPVKKPANIEDSENDLIFTEKLQGDVPIILKTSCYDCHSSQTHYPCYSHVAPVSWLVASDVEEGRQKLNFSNWKQNDKRRKIRQLEDIKEEVQQGEMPMSIYTFIHRKAKLTEAQKQLLIKWSDEMAEKVLNN